MKTVPLVLLSILVVCSTSVRVCAELHVTAIGKSYSPPEGRTPVRTTRSNLGGSTSIRNNAAGHLIWKSSGYFQRNRDLGQVFTPQIDFQLDAIVLRTGPSDSAVKAGAPGAEVFIQFFEVLGAPKINDNGTPKETNAKHGFSTNHRCDDFIEGVEYHPFHIVRGGRFPDLPPTRDMQDEPTRDSEAKLHYLRFDLTGDDELVFEAGKRYAFMLGFVEPGRQRAFTLGNENAASASASPSLTDQHDYYHDGWGLRREGDGTVPPTMTGEPEFPANADLRQRLTRESVFDQPPARFELSPTTDGYPDVDTYRDLEFYLESRPDKVTLRVEEVSTPPSGPQVKISQPFGRRGPTSFRRTDDEERNLKQSPSAADAEYNGGKYWKRDRDLGQTFTTTDGEPFRLDAITVRVGPSGHGTFDHSGSPGAKVSLQILRVSGTPQVNDNGTTSGTVSNGYPGEPRADDYITGEIYEHVMVARGGILPDRLELGGPVPGDPMQTFNTKRPTTLSRGTMLRFDLLGDAEIVLEPNSRYAFLFMFDELAASRALPLDNWDNLDTMGPYAGGHAIRREGSIEHPWTRPNEVFNGVDDPAKKRFSELPYDWDVRLRMQPSTWGRPDVDTYRDLLFYVEGKPVLTER